MNDPGSSPPKGRPDPQPATTASGPPSPYRDVGLIPPVGPARTWGLTVLGLPLLLVLLLGLAGSLTHDDSGSAGQSVGLGSPASGWPETSPTTAYGEPIAPSTYGTPDTADTAATPGTTQSGDIGDVFGASPDQTTASAEPRGVVTAYYQAINNRDYQTAWDLGGKNLDPDYDAFVSGFATTKQDTISIVSAEGAVVRLVIDALLTDGTSHSYDATYTVRDGEITDGKATPTT